MEKSIINRTSASDVNFELVNATIEKIKAFVKQNDYQFKDTTGFDQITESNFKAALSNISWKKRKKLASFIWFVNIKPTLATINKFFHFLMKNVLKSDSRIRVILSTKEIAIQEKRKVYKEALAKVRAAYADYKTEKGDFYKDQATVRDYLKRKNAA